MGKPRLPDKALLFVALLYCKEDAFLKAKGILTKRFGGLSYESGALPWEHSEYYRDEIGWPIKRRFLSFRDLIDPGEISDIKLITNSIESDLSVEGRRSINLDPGYVTLSKVVLATTKNYCHRIYLGGGIYGEVTLIFREGRFQPHDFTYPDYRSEEYIRIFSELRGLLKRHEPFKQSPPCV